MENKMAAMLTIIMGWLAMLHVTCGAPLLIDYIENGCGVCPPGEGVKQMCTKYQDTVCDPCMTGYFSPEHSMAQRCHKCTSCAKGFFEIKPCTSVSDISCTPCVRAADVNSEDYRKNCVQSFQFFDYMDYPMMMDDESLTADTKTATANTKTDGSTRNDDPRADIVEATEVSPAESDVIPEVSPEMGMVPDVVPETEPVSKGSSTTMQVTPEEESGKETEPTRKWKFYEGHEGFNKGLTMVELDVTNSSGSTPDIDSPAGHEETSEDTTFAFVVLIVTAGIVFFAVGFIGKRAHTKYFSSNGKEEDEKKPLPQQPVQKQTNVEVTYRNNNGRDGRGKYSGLEYKEKILRNSIVEESEEESEDESDDESEEEDERDGEDVDEVFLQKTSSPVVVTQAKTPLVLVTDMDAPAEEIQVADTAAPATKPSEDTKVETLSVPKTDLVVASSQSPVDIITEKAKVDETLEKTPLLYKYVAEHTTAIVNTGSTVKVELDGEGSLLQGGPLGDKRYRLDHFHFHWGGESTRGAEHTVNGGRSAAELHLVHWNTTDFDTYSDAMKSRGGVAILAIFLKVGKKEHLKIKVLTDKMAGIPYRGESRTMPVFDPASILPENTDDYWTYSGSDTSPPYPESVTWIVFRDHITVTETQMKAFRSLYKGTKEETKLLEKGEGMLVDNYRDIQPLGTRTINASFA